MSPMCKYELHHDMTNYRASHILKLGSTCSRPLPADMTIGAPCPWSMDKSMFFLHGFYAMMLYHLDMDAYLQIYYQVIRIFVVHECPLWQMLNEFLLL